MADERWRRGQSAADTSDSTTFTEDQYENKANGPSPSDAAIQVLALSNRNCQSSRRGATVRRKPAVDLHRRSEGRARPA